MIFTNNKTTRVCCKCKVEKPLTLDNFDTRAWRNKKAKEGDKEFARLCKPCRLIETKTRYHNKYKNDLKYIEGSQQRSRKHYIKEGKEKATKRKMLERYARKVANPEAYFSKEREKSKKWRKLNPEKVRMYNSMMKHTRRALGKLTREVFETITEETNNVCVFCGKPATTIEHILCIKRGGTNDINNLTTACASCNSSKNDRYLLNFIWEKVKLEGKNNAL